MPANRGVGHPSGHALAGAVRTLGNAPFLLLLTLSTVFLFGNDHRGLFSRFDHHNIVSDHYLAMAGNLSPEHRFLAIRRHSLNADGTPTLSPYARFPVGGLLLIKLAITPFDHSPSASIQAARSLMLLCFVATGLLAYLSLCRLFRHRWIALTATLLTFSSYYWLYYNDMVSTEVVPDILVVMLCFHGMLIFAQDGRFRQLLVKTCIALLIGWHVYGLLLPFILLGLAKEGRMAWRRRPFASLRAAAAALPRSRHLRLGVAALLFGMAVLSFNFFNEYQGLNGKTALTELPSFQSMLRRTGLENGGLNWRPFIETQFSRIGRMSLPYALQTNVDALGWGPRWLGESQRVRQSWAGLAVFCACLLGLWFVRHRMLVATLVLSGFCWALPMRNQAFHDFESLVHVGVPLIFHSLLLLCLQRWFGSRLIVGLAAVAALVFVLSSQQMGRVGQNAEDVEQQRAIQSDFQAIRSLSLGKTVFLDQWKHLSRAPTLLTDYYLRGRVSLMSTEADRRDLADFIINPEREPASSLLTPENQLLFLHDRAVHSEWVHAQMDALAAAAGEPIIRAHFDVHLHDKWLIYLRDACRREDALHRFFLHAFLMDKDELPVHRRRFGFDNLDFYSTTHGLRSDGSCGALVRLPAYAIARIHTGQFVPGAGGNIWKGEASWGF